jgi:hypothetical protein
MKASIRFLGLSLVLLGITSRIVHAEPKEAYTPGLGEIMGYLQVRHAKLAFAG